MKTKPVILLAAISALLVTGAAAQQEAPPAGAPPPPPGARDGAPPPDRPRDGGPGGPRERGPREGDGRVEGPREGANPGGPREGGGRGPREGAPLGGGPRDGAAPNPGPGRGGFPPGGPGGPRDGAPRNPGGSPGEFHRGGGPQEGEPQRAPELRKEKRAFLGIVAAPLPPVLTAQLGLSEGYGLVVQAVAPESPAAKAGLQQYDVIKLLNDQQIVDQGQLATLVKGIGSGKEVTLTVLRKAQEQKITATLGEHEVTVGGPEHHGFGGTHGGFGHPGLDAMRGFGEHLRDNPDAAKELGERARHFQEQMRSNPERAKEMEEKMREFQNRAREGRGPREGFGRPGAAVDPERLLQEAQPTGGAQIRVETQVGSTTIDGAQAHLRLKDATGEIEVATEDGKRVLTARDSEGKVIFTGPVNTDEERAAVPEPIRKKLADIHIRQTGNGVVSSISVGESAAAGPAPESFDEADFQ
jgi:serine protease Do